MSDMWGKEASGRMESSATIFNILKSSKQRCIIYTPPKTVNIFNPSKFVFGSMENGYLLGKVVEPTFSEQKLRQTRNHPQIFTKYANIISRCQIRIAKKIHGRVLYPGNTIATRLPETSNENTWKLAIPKGKVIFQPSIFRGELLG